MMSDMHDALHAHGSISMAVKLPKAPLGKMLALMSACAGFLLISVNALQVCIRLFCSVFLLGVFHNLHT